MKHTIKQVDLANGAKGLLIDVPNTQTVSLLAGFNSGNDFCDPKEYPELSHVMEHVMMGANKTYPTRIAFSAEIEKNGAYSNAFTTDYFNGYEYESAAYEAEHMVDLMAAQLSTPKFLPVEVQKEIGNVREELNGYLSNYAQVSYDRLLAATMERPTYEHSLATLKAINSNVARNYHRRTHTGGNMRFIFAGALRRNPNLAKRFEKGLTELPQGDRLAIPVKQPQHLAETVYVKKDIPQVYYRFHQHCPQLSIEDEPVMAALSILLTGRYKSRILGEARERGLAYHVYSGSNNYVGYAIFSVNFFATPANIGKLFKIIAKQLRNMRLGQINKTEVEEAKQLLIGRRLRIYKTPEDLINWYYYNFFANDHIEPFDKGTTDIEKITVKDLQRVADHLLQQPKWGLALVGSLPAVKVKELRQILATIWD